MGASVLNFENIIGQRPIVRWCQSVIQNNSLPKVSLFVGPSGVGKTSTAKLLACEYAANKDVALMEDYKDKVIKNKINLYEGVHVYNMSNLDSTAVAAVREDLNLAFTKNGRKVIIMDEAHGMKEDAQDTLLTAFESLPDGVHIIICTTDRSKLRAALVSRCVVRYFSRLSTNEMKQLITLRLQEKKIRLMANETIVFNYLISYAGHEARAINNIIDQIPEGSQLAMESLEMYVPVYEPKEILQLIKYLYNGDLIAGLNLIPDLTIDDAFYNILIDILRIALGDKANHFSRQDENFIKELCSNDVGRLSGFVIDCSKQKLTAPRLSALFIYWNVRKPESAISADSTTVQIDDLKKIEVRQASVDIKSDDGEVIFENFDDFLRDKMIAE